LKIISYFPYIDVEAPSFMSSSHLVGLVVRFSDDDKMVFSLPFHLRYPSPINSGLSSLTIHPPLIYPLSYSSTSSSKLISHPFNDLTITFQLKSDFHKSIQNNDQKFIQLSISSGDQTHSPTIQLSTTLLSLILAFVVSLIPILSFLKRRKT